MRTTIYVLYMYMFSLRNKKTIGKAEKSALFGAMLESLADDCGNGLTKTARSDYNITKA